MKVMVVLHTSIRGQQHDEKSGILGRPAKTNAFWKEKWQMPGGKYIWFYHEGFIIWDVVLCKYIYFNYTWLYPYFFVAILAANTFFLMVSFQLKWALKAETDGLSFVWSKINFYFTSILFQ